MNQHPPKWAIRFLEWYCNPAQLEEIQGDAVELFNRRVKKSPTRARIQFIWDVMRFFRWRNINKNRINKYSPIPSAMYKSYFITGYRSMFRNTTSSLINIIGLSVALSVAIMFFVIIDSYYNLDAMHVNGARTGMVTNHIQQGNGISLNARSPFILADMLRENSAVESVVRATRARADVRNGDKVFSEIVFFTDPDFMKDFSFRMLSGNRDGLKDKNQIMLSREKAVKYFGNDNVVGENISVRFNGTDKYEFTISGVFEDTPANSSMYIDFLIPMAIWQDLYPQYVQDWSNNSVVTFVMMKEGNSFAQVQPSLKNYLEIQSKADPKNPVVEAEMIPFTHVATRSYQIDGTLSWSNQPAGMIAFAVIGSLLVLVACFNYMNVAVASVSTRLKEIGIRKVIGGRRREIIQQFLTENLMMCTIALGVGFLIAYFFLVPGWNSLYTVKTAFEISSPMMAVVFFGGTLLFTVLVSGAYPAMYVSSFNSVKILRGKEKFGSKGLFSKILLTFQLTLSIICVMGCLLFVGSGTYYINKDWGYDPSQTVAVRLYNPNQYEKLRTLISSETSVMSYAGSSIQIGKNIITTSVSVKEENNKAVKFNVGFKYLQSMNIRLKEGRFFDENIQSDKEESAIVNETFVRRMGWKDPLNEAFEEGGVKHYVIGVVEDFYYTDYYTAVEPAFFCIVPQKYFSYMVIKTQPGMEKNMESFIKGSWKEIGPDDPYDGFLQASVFDRFNDWNRSSNKVVIMISLVAILLSAMGLYGLLSYNLTRRLKEYSVRKVFGAKLKDILILMNRDYQWIVLISLIVGIPIGAYLMQLMLKVAYPEGVPTFIWPYVVAISVVLITVILAILTQLRRVIVENPTRTLRME